MKLTNAAIEVAKLPEVRIEIMKDQSVSEYTVLKWIREQDDTLTKAAIVEIIKRHSDLDWNEIIESETAKTA